MGLTPQVTECVHLVTRRGLLVQVCVTASKSPGESPVMCGVPAGEAVYATDHVIREYLGMSAY